MNRSAHAIAEQVVGPVEWQDAASGYCRCPGADLHTTRNGRRDALLMIDGAPTIYCFHSSCQGAVELANRNLRRALATGQPGRQHAPSLASVKAAEARVDKLRQIQSQARQELEGLEPWAPAEMPSESPMPMAEEPYEDWQFLLALFGTEAVVWIGDVTDSCPDDASPERKAECAQHFRPVKDWLNESSAPGQFTCPSTFVPGCHSRSNANVTGTPFLVIESDTLPKPLMGGHIRWLSRSLPLRAVVDTAGKSLHGWFLRPSPDKEKHLKLVLPAMGCDPALFKLSQPCRLPGAMRGDRWQQLLWFDDGRARR